MHRKHKKVLNDMFYNVLIETTKNRQGLLEESKKLHMNKSVNEYYRF